MKLSEKTIDVLKNFAAINPNMVFKPGKSITTIAEAKNIVAIATIDEEIPSEFGIYDLSEFLSTMSLFDEPELDFTKDSVIIMENKSSIRYFYSATDLLTTPTKQVNMPKADVKLMLSADVINKIKKAAAVLGHATLEINGKNGTIVVNVADLKNATANKYAIELDDKNTCKDNFSFVMVIGNLKMLPGDYEVSISSKLISHFKNTTSPAEYYIALEKTSTYDK